VAVDYADAKDLAGKLDKLAKGLASGNPAIFKMLRQQGVFLGRGPAPKLAFLYTGQGSQYVNMLKRDLQPEPIVKATFDEADRVMTPLLGRRSRRSSTSTATTRPVKAANKQLMQTEITQPAVLATDLSLTRLLAAYGIKPDMVMGHSLGEYGALVAAGSLTLDRPWRRSAPAAARWPRSRWRTTARWPPCSGRWTRSSGRRGGEGYVVVANINSYNQAVVGGATKAVEKIVETFAGQGHERRAHPGQPRLPHLDRRRGLGAVRQRAAPPQHGRPQAADRRQRHRRVLPGRRDDRDDARLRRQADRLAGPVRQGPADPVCRRRSRLRRGRAQEGAARLRRGRPRQQARRRARALFTNHPKLGRHRRVQPGPVRFVCRGAGSSPLPLRPSRTAAAPPRPLRPPLPPCLVALRSGPSAAASASHRRTRSSPSSASCSPACWSRA
jgi:hypothetical protein